MHLDEEQVQRFLHGELALAAVASARGHLARCTECSARVAEAAKEEDEVSALLHNLDHRAPRIDAETVAAKAQAHADAHGRDFGRLRWAAGVVLALGVASAAYTAPGSPLRAWVESVVERMGDRPVASPLSDVPGSAPIPPPLQATDPGVAGIAVAPGRELVILFASPQTTGQVHVSLTDGAEVVVRAPIGAATYTSDIDRLVIDNTGSSAAFEIQIPRSAPGVAIQVGGELVFRKQGPRVTTNNSTDTPNQYVLPLTRSGS